MTMKSLFSFSRTCAQRTFTSRAQSTKPVFASQLQQRTQPLQTRHLSTTTTTAAQPMELTSSTTPASQSEGSTLAADTLSRAPSETTTTTTTLPRRPRRQPRPTKPLSSSSSSASASTPPPTPKLHIGTISRTGTMTNAVQITSRTQTFDKFLQKHYTRPKRLLAYDPNPAGFLREGDVVEYSGYDAQEQAERERKRKSLENRLLAEGKIRLRTNKGKVRKIEDVGVKKRNSKWVVRRVVSPFGLAVEDR